MSDWYEEIEPEVRDLVRYLRNNGINTECSCGHKMYIQCQYPVNEDIYGLYILLHNYFSDRNEEPYFEIEASITFHGWLFRRLEIKLRNK